MSMAVSSGQVVITCQPQSEPACIDWAFPPAAKEGPSAWCICHQSWLHCPLIEKNMSAGSGGFLSTSSWPTFGLVGEKQAALYYGVCLLFTVFFFKNSGIRHSLMGIARSNSHGKSARLGA